MAHSKHGFYDFLDVVFIIVFVSTAFVGDAAATDDQVDDPLRVVRLRRHSRPEDESTGMFLLNLYGITRVKEFFLLATFITH